MSLISVLVSGCMGNEVPAKDPDLSPPPPGTKCRSAWTKDGGLQVLVWVYFDDQRLPTPPKSNVTASYSYDYDGRQLNPAPVDEGGCASVRVPTHDVYVVRAFAPHHGDPGCQWTDAKKINFSSEAFFSLDLELSHVCS